MTDKSTIEGCRSTVDEQIPGLPSFVRQLREWDGSQNTMECFDHWAPEGLTGCPAIDHETGRQHCRAAMAFSRQLGGATFLLFVVMAMQGRAIGDIERGFIAELVGPALAGRKPLPVSDEVMREVEADGSDVGRLRELEGHMGLILDYCRDKPGPFYDYVLDLVAGAEGQWIGAAICMLAGAALNGGLN
jgi:hypothetical protein